MRKPPVFAVNMILAALLAAVPVQAQEAADALSDSTRGFVPQTYTVEKGDTLWDIAERFFRNPFDWRDIWERNTAAIDDPHWIYPGQVFELREDGTVKVDGVEQFTLPPRRDAAEIEEPQGPLFNETAPLMPAAEKKPVLTVAEPAETADDSRLIRSLDEPRPVFTSEVYNRTGFISRRSELPRGRVVELGEDYSSATTFDTVVVDIGSDDGVSLGDILSIMVVGDAVEHPETGRDLGVVVRMKGLARVTAVGKGSSTCVIVSNFDPVGVDDLVMPYRAKESPLFDAWIKPGSEVAGSIIALNEPMLSIHTSDILYIDVGSVDDVRVGDRFTIYQSNPLMEGSGYRESIGTIEAVNVMANESAVVVVGMKDKRISIGDRVELVARCRLLR